MSARQQRHQLIRRLVDSQRISSQEELVGLLEERGVSCTQATLSRDLRDLAIVRHNTSAGPVYQANPSAEYVDTLHRIIGMEILGVRHNGQLVVIRTLIGRADGVALYLDHINHPNILGTLAGDDTVFVAPADCSAIEQLTQDIRDLGMVDEEKS